ncbi:sodium-translocating pyrophosphatase [Methanomassiliicoccus luminyensis]|uniref:sodium-translocating pyrophosphatase n=1 Tax=Methanomassiliicoccus luminyensis TaxID=1080712 RepID=UPI00037A8EBC|nr:sodium-translocating pyrophosphatase [Methanomassiliicoccus luminyensis]
MEIDALVYLIPIAGIIGLLIAVLLTRIVLRKDTGTPEMKAIGDAIREGAMAYLARQYKTIAVISVILAVIIAIALRWEIAVAFLLGAGFSCLSGYIGMYVSVNSNIRTASGARRSLNEALQTSFRGGAVSGLAVIALSLLGVAGIFFLYLLFVVPEPLTSPLGYGLESWHVVETLNLAVGYAFGASFAALFAQLGGGIYTKAADVGADLVGKVEAGIPEDDPRNPAVIADLVGDNVGDCAGRGADLFESTAAENIGAMILGAAIFGFTGNANWVFFPLVVMAFCLLASIVGIFLVKLRNENEEPMRALNRGYYVTAVIAAIGIYFLSDYMLGTWHFFVCAVIGIILSIAIVFITQYYTSGSYRPVREIARNSETGPATNIISGFSIGLETTAAPIIAIAIALLSSYFVGQEAAYALLTNPGANEVFIFGLFGTAAATMGMLATAGFVLAMDTFGPITDNAGGIIEMSQQPDEIRNRTDKLDSVGNTTKALTKGYALGSAALAAFLLFAAFFQEVAVKLNQPLLEVFRVDLAQPPVFVAALIGGMLVFLFSSLAIRAVGNAAGDMINEVRRQFKEKPGILAGTEKPDYAQCVDISTKGALKAMILPGILPVVTPILVGLIWRFAYPDAAAQMSVQAVGGFLMVATITGILMAIVLNNGGGAWDNAKKYIESGHHGGKKSPAHAAAVVGDTVGDPFKDTAGPSLHVLVKLLSTITLVFASLFIIT